MALAAINLSAIAGGTGGFALTGQATGDYSGRSVASAGDINGDGFDDLIIGADSAGSGDAGRAYVVFGSASAFAANVSLSSIAAGTGGFVLTGSAASDFAGFAVSSAGDINGDGFADLMVAARYADRSGDDQVGKVYVMFGKASGFASSVSLGSIGNGTGGFALVGETAFDRAGKSIAAAGDVNGDGFADMIVGVPGGSAPGLASAGKSYVVFGANGGFGASVELSAIAGGTGGFALTGGAAGDVSGYSVSSAGDINGDGFADLVVGAPFADPLAGNAAGISYVVYGAASGLGSRSLASVAAGTGGFAITGQAGFDYSGFSVASAGDFNGDGIADLVVGAYGADPTAGLAAGRSYVVFGSAGGFAGGVALGNVAAGTGGFVINGQAADERSGFVVAAAGDVNGDGRDDLVVSAPFADPTAGARAGRVYVVFGTATPGSSINLSQIAAGTGGFVINGQQAASYAGESVAAAGDINGDGFDDLVIGARRFDPSGATNAGRSYVVYGRDFTASVTHPGTTAPETLTGTAGADVMVGGQGADVLVGNGGADAMRGGAGNDRLVIADLGFLRVDGGGGTDTLALAGAGLALDLSTIGDTKLSDIEVIDISGSGANSLTVTAREVLNLSSGSNILRVDGGADDTLVLSGGAWTQGGTAGGYVTYTRAGATVEVDADISTAPCFAAGTRILTVFGEVAVETLREGDMLAVLGGAGVRRVRWIGHRSLRLSQHPCPWDVQPVRVRANAFGPGLPRRDLRLSPDHAVFVDGMLVPVRRLINGATILQEAVAAVTYFHVELADAEGQAVHDVLLAEGLPSESFLDTGNRAAFANGGAVVMAHADFARGVWQQSACAPLLEAGNVLAAIRARVLGQAAALGHVLTTEPDLHLCVDGVTQAGQRNGEVWRFAVPAGADVVRLVSRSMAPGWIQVDGEPGDMRCLGVAVARLALDGAGVALDDPRLLDGWHGVEAGWRWTTGTAELATGGAAMLELVVVPMLRYWRDGAPPVAEAALLSA